VSSLPTKRKVERLAARLADAQAKADAIRAELELAAVEMRAEGASLAEIGEAMSMSRPGVLKMLRRHEVGPPP
jgi:hypothetical protein